MRKGTNPFAAGLDLTTLSGLFFDVYNHYLSKGYFQEAFGYDCVDAGCVPGSLGSDVGAQFRLRVRKDNLWPIQDNYQAYTEDDLFDVIEFLHDHVSKPTNGYYHSFNACGMHYDQFDGPAGQSEYRSSVNWFLRDYGEGHELSDEGEILSLAPYGLTPIHDAALPAADPENIEQRVRTAERKYRRHHSTLNDRRDAIRDLADVLEYLRPQLQEVLPRKDESDLFNLANNFGIRHHNDQQKTAYDRKIWYSWMFYYYLATIHASLRLIEKYGEGAVDE